MLEKIRSKVEKTLEELRTKSKEHLDKIRKSEPVKRIRDIAMTKIEIEPKILAGSILAGVVSFAIGLNIPVAKVSNQPNMEDIKPVKVEIVTQVPQAEIPELKPTSPTDNLAKIRATVTNPPSIGKKSEILSSRKPILDPEGKGAKTLYDKLVEKETKIEQSKKGNNTKQEEEKISVTPQTGKKPEIKFNPKNPSNLLPPLLPGQTIESRAKEAFSEENQKKSKIGISRADFNIKLENEVTKEMQPYLAKVAKENKEKIQKPEQMNDMEDGEITEEDKKARSLYNLERNRIYKMVMQEFNKKYSIDEGLVKEKDVD